LSTERQRPSATAGARSSGLGRRGAALLVAVLAAAGCRNDMQDQPRYEVNAPSRFFADGRADRPLVPGVVAAGSVHDDPVYELGSVDGRPAVDIPVPVTRDLLLRGRQRYDIYCAPCHSRVGDGDGMIVQRGFRRPPSFHVDRLRAAPAGSFYEAITQGFGVMPSYAAQIPIDDRWAIVAYVRALQLSQMAPASDVPPGELAKLDAGETPDASPANERRGGH
jgi:mono/diheme cytochrome c family protein